MFPEARPQIKTFGKFKGFFLRLLGYKRVFIDRANGKDHSVKAVFRLYRGKWYLMDIIELVSNS